MSTDPRSWEVFADAVLCREALVCRSGRGLPVRDFAGMYVDDADVDRILRDLPGLDGSKSPSPHAAAMDQLVERGRTALHASLTDTSTFASIASVLGLSHDEVEVLAVVCAVEADPQRQRLVAYLQDSIALPRVTLDLLERLFESDHAGALAVAPAAALRMYSLIDVEPEGPWSVWTVRPAHQLSWALAGSVGPDRALPVGLSMLTDLHSRPSKVSFVAVHGGDRRTRTTLAVASLGATACLTCPPPADMAELDALVRAGAIHDAAIIIEVDRDLTQFVSERIATTPRICWAVSSVSPLPLDTMPDRDWREVQAPRTLISDREWQQATGADNRSGRRFTPTQMDLVARAVPAVEGDVDAAVRRLSSGQLDRLAVRIAPRRTWDDLVLPADQIAALKELGARYRLRHRVYEEWGLRAVPSAGLIAVFAGPSGTGKTLAAEVIAGDLGLDVYKVDLSAVVSKYIGETEKNLERIFSVAAAAEVMLFFDEADALFGKRSDVGDAHDRYANIEVSYLLQRLEAYDGLVVLATNLQRNMDAAFLRRIHVAVEFGIPDELSRRAIWGLSFPPDAPVDDIDLDFLARQFKISGGSIRNAAVTAAFLAADEETAIGMPHVMHALKREFQKLGRLRTETEFDRYYSLVQPSRTG